MNLFARRCCFTRNSICFFVITVILLTGCQRFSAERELVNAWQVVSFRTPLANSGGDGPASIFHFYKNGKYTQFGAANIYAYGIWRYSPTDTIIGLHPTGGSEILDAYYHIDRIAPGSLQMTLYRNFPMRRGTEELTYTLAAGPAASEKDDPYTPELHRWRSKPPQPETNKQIVARVKNYLQFLKTLYRYFINSNIETMRVDWFPHPLRMHYGNGVRMAYDDELFGWYDCFYDSAQAVKGYQVISGPIQEITLKKVVPKPERNLDCVEQLLDKIRE